MLCAYASKMYIQRLTSEMYGNKNTMLGTRVGISMVNVHFGI
jgi:hypothetical protein